MKYWILGLVLFIALGWVLMANDLAIMKVFMPAHEQVRRQTFEQSKAYRQGMSQELENMMLEYYKADKDGKAALASVILHRSADVDRNTLSPELQSFISKLKQERTNEKY